VSPCPKTTASLLQSVPELVVLGCVITVQTHWVPTITILQLQFVPMRLVGVLEAQLQESSTRVARLKLNRCLNCTQDKNKPLVKRKDGGLLGVLRNHQVHQVPVLQFCGVSRMREYLFVGALTRFALHELFQTVEP